MRKKRRVAFPWAIVLADGRDSVIRGNSGMAIPGSVTLKNGKPVRTMISARGGTNNLVCGNKTPDVPDLPAAQPCPH